MISLNHFQPDIQATAGNQSGKEVKFFVGTFADNFVSSLKVAIACRKVNSIPRDPDVIFHRRWKRFICGTDTLHIPLLEKRGPSFMGLKDLLIGLKFNDAIPDPIGVSIASKVPVENTQFLQKLRISSIQVHGLLKAFRRLFPPALYLVDYSHEFEQIRTIRKRLRSNG